VSFSANFEDCSWFSFCNKTLLDVPYQPPGSGRHFTTVRVKEAAVSCSTVGSNGIQRRVRTSGRSSTSLSVIVQYYRHPRQLVAICRRLLQHPAVEVVIHADSHAPEDLDSFRAARALSQSRVRLVRSNNVHEIRGYNRGVRAASRSSSLLAFTQDDRLPPENASWVDSVLRVFDVLPPSFAALGLHRGSPWAWHRNQKLSDYAVWGGRPMPAHMGSCGDPADREGDDTLQWARLPTRTMEHPIASAAFLNVGPIVVRASAFRALGGFNLSDSPRGAPGMGFDAEFVARLWLSGWQAAVACPSRRTALRNGCGRLAGAAAGGNGSQAGSLGGRAEKNRMGNRNLALYQRQFDGSTGHGGSLADEIECRASQFQAWLHRELTEGASAAPAEPAPLLALLRQALPGCVHCTQVSDRVAALGWHTHAPRICAGGVQTRR
jgi:hypothetical protein